MNGMEGDRFRLPPPIEPARARKITAGKLAREREENSGVPVEVKMRFTLWRHGRSRSSAEMIFSQSGCRPSRSKQTFRLVKHVRSLDGRFQVELQMPRLKMRDFGRGLE
jgi:hypothetical protein